MRTIQMITLVAIVAFLVPSARAQVPGTSPAPRAGAEVTSPGVVSGAAELMPEQRAALTKLQQDHWTAMRDLWTQIRAKRAALLAARRAGDPAQVQALEKELGELYAARAQERRRSASRWPT